MFRRGIKMKIQKIKRDDFIIKNWAGGKTEEIFIYPENANYATRDFSLRISTATVELDVSEFTKLPHVKRIITPLSAEIVLFEKNTNSKKKKLTTLKPYELYSFLGDTNIISEGRCRDFNVMTKGKTTAELFSLKANESIDLKANSFLFLFSYEAKGEVLLHDTKLFIDKFDFFMISEIVKSSQNFSIKNNSDNSILLGNVTLL